MNELYIKTVFQGGRAEMEKLKSALEGEPVKGNLTRISIDGEDSPTWLENLEVAYGQADGTDGKLEICYTSRSCADPLRDYCHKHGIKFKQNWFYLTDEGSQWETDVDYLNEETGEHKTYVEEDAVAVAELEKMEQAANRETGTAGDFCEPEPDEDDLPF